MFEVNFVKGYLEQELFRRVLGAAFLTHDPVYVEFVYRMLLDFFANLKPNHSYSAKYFADCKDALDIQILKEFSWDPASSTKKDEEFGPIFEYQALQASLYALELQHPMLRAWVRNHSSFPPDHRARICGVGWHSTSSTQLVGGEVLDLGPGWNGMAEAQWRHEVEMLQQGLFSYQGRGYPEPVRQVD